ncbi:RNA-directed DNA polymerase, eukaryota [Tanacetum coccineum]
MSLDYGVIKRNGVLCSAVNPDVMCKDDELSNEGSFDENGGLRITQNVEEESDLEEVAEIIFEKEQASVEVKEGCNSVQKETRSEDPFNIYDLLDKKKSAYCDVPNSDDTLKYPSGFTPETEWFDTFVKQTWNDAQVTDSNAISMFMKKMKYLKEKIRMWVKANKKLKSHRNGLQEELSKIDLLLDKGEGSSTLISKRMEILKSIQDFVKLDTMELAQKAKDQMGDRRRRKFKVLSRGSQIKNETTMQFELLERRSKKAVWDCGVDKSPGPDGFTFGFYRRYWTFLENDVVEAVLYFFNQCNFPKAFVAKRHILDGPFILNELFQWYKMKKKHTMIFKADFEKAYDLVRWDYLDDILKMFGFGEKWCGWIQNCLLSSKGSVIVNGSPTKEFQFHRGLKQGDPLSPFLFLLIMESLHISMQRVVDAGLFKANIDTILRVLDCFYHASGLRINMLKSKLMGISVSSDKVDQAAKKIGCAILQVPFSYLGSKVGCLMSRIQSWSEIVNNILTRLSKWKLKLSIGGRITLLEIFPRVVANIPYVLIQRLKKNILVALKLSHDDLLCSFRRAPRAGAEELQYISSLRED